ncbi:HNH endonuclease [Plebeiibacterium sediminum]|uniref:HNH endonuclease n=1 Tax=Plebeiibacterium sediminum TaxID=2992112 RepID=A0AAE3SEC7_9BACT|nr:HNH endonuclease [Plebeiobacterium sediminum]MCW3785882.1 HNH endonuclease [Plebeiobacterium sediminum]
MEFKTIKYPGVKDEIKISEDGSLVEYNGTALHQSLIKSPKSRHGYYQVSIKGVVMYVHRLVALAFVPNPKPVSYKMVLHKNCVSTDNRYQNLEWGNQKALTQNRIKNGLAGAKSLEVRGSSTISYEDALKIAERLDNGELAKIIAKEFNVSEMSIVRIRKRYCKTKTKAIRYPKEIKMNILKLCEHHDPVQVAKITNIPYHTVWRWYTQSKR